MCECFDISINQISKGKQFSRRSIVKSLICLPIVHISQNVFADGIAPPVSPVPPDLTSACNFYPADPLNTNVFSFGNNIGARDIVRKITSTVGLQPNFEVIEGGVPNAAAVIQNGIRYVYYNQTFINHIDQQTADEWGSWTIMAHEVGHHLNGHTVTGGGSRPPIELQADEFAGFCVNKLGGTLVQACSPYNAMDPAGSATHPPRADRLAAVTKGWNNAQGGNAPVAPNHPNQTPAPVASPEDMLKAVIKSIQAGVLPSFPMEPALKNAVINQIPIISPALQAKGALNSITLTASGALPGGNGMGYEYDAQFSGGVAKWKMGVSPNGVLNTLWVN